MASFFRNAKAKPDKNNYQRRASDHPPTVKSIRKEYERPTSFTNELPWMEYQPEHQCFLLDDGISVGSLFKIRTVGSEARTQTFMKNTRNGLQEVINAIPEERGNPWILQLYLQDEPDFGRLTDKIRNYVKPSAKETEFTDAFLETMDQHFQSITSPEGLFHDELVTGATWRGQQRSVRAALYRHTSKNSVYDYFDASPHEKLVNVSDKLMTAFRTTGVGIERAGGKDLYEWMFRWFNPNPETTGGDTEALLKMSPYPGDDEMPYGFDFGESLMSAMPHSDEKSGIWWFDNRPHKAITAQGLKSIPEIGLFGAERKSGEHVFALFDKMPEGAVMAMTIVIQPQDEMRDHLMMIQNAAIGDLAEAQMAADDAKVAARHIARGNKLFPVKMTFYLKGENESDLRQKINLANSLIRANGVQTIVENVDLIPLNTYKRNLPMAYHFHHDRKVARRSRLVFSKHTANLLPVYGRSTGTGNPGFVFYNRGGEPLLVDPLNRFDRKKNAHLLLLGPTGSGKSAALVYLLLQVLAIYRARIFIIEAGNSFGPLGMYLKAHGVSVNQFQLTKDADVSLPPFGDAQKLLDDVDINAVKSGNITEKDADQDENEDDDSRDLLGEMEISALFMITGGEKREMDRVYREDRAMIRNAIIFAAETVLEQSRSQILTEDVVHALRHLPDLPEERKKIASGMADRMSLFCTGLAGRFFNRPGVKYPDVDVTIMDMGIMAKEGYEDMLNVAYIGLMNHINDLVERHQYDDRMNVVLTDEGHLIMVNPLLSPYQVKMVKMWRKLGTWFWLATQNLKDFPDISEKMLSMMEWWLCLSMEKDEVDQISRFRDLSDEQKALILAAKKSPGQYTEGVILTDHLSTLFRNVLPPLVLALAMTEKEEKAERRQIMKELGCTELEAIYEVAERIKQSRK